LIIPDRYRPSNGWNEPWWDEYRPLLDRLGDGGIPGPQVLNSLLPADARSGGGKPLRFVPASSLAGVDYERHIFETGEVSTREDSWHDLFNALVWCRLPKLKAAMNALHYAHLDEEKGGRRGPQRDALTLLDESGAIVVSSDRTLLEALSRRDWKCAFVDLRPCWAGDTRAVICGHALLEKLLAPYKSVTAHALLLFVEPFAMSRSEESFWDWLDRTLAAGLRAGFCRSPADLSPLPLMGIPRWRPRAVQDSAFYADATVFRPPPADHRPSDVHAVPSGDPSPHP
jgi:hypothetical protein